MPGLAGHLMTFADIFQGGIGHLQIFKQEKEARRG